MKKKTKKKEKKYKMMKNEIFAKEKKPKEFLY